MPIRKNILVILIILMLGVLSVFLFLIYQEKQINNKKDKTIKISEEQKTTKNYPEDLKGKVYLTLKEKDNLSLKKNKNNLGVYIFDFEKNNFEEKYLFENCQILGGEINYKSEMLVTGRCGGDLNDQVYTINRNKELSKITNTAGRFKKEAVWSDNAQKISFMSSLKGLVEKPTFDINSWEVVVSDLKGRAEKISNGVHPFFSPDGKKILFLKEDGLNLVDIKTKEEQNVFNFEADVTFHMDLSLDKSRLVISDPLKKNIIIYKIKSWKNFQLEEFYKIDTPNSYISWPKFSPYENHYYLVYEEFFDNGKIDLVVYDLKNSKKHSSTDLSFYEHGSMWINDWR
jgi:hypothetical protein